MISTADKDRFYYDQIAALKRNTAFLQEINERRTRLLVAMSQLDERNASLPAEFAQMKGQIMCLNWIETTLINMKWQPPIVQEETPKPRTPVPSVPGGTPKNSLR